jgi:hypothetical protein
MLGASSAQGDSGGGVTAANRLVGIISCSKDFDFEAEPDAPNPFGFTRSGRATFITPLYSERNQQFLLAAQKRGARLRFESAPQPK